MCIKTTKKIIILMEEYQSNQYALFTRTPSGVTHVQRIFHRSKMYTILEMHSPKIQLEISAFNGATDVLCTVYMYIAIVCR